MHWKFDKSQAERLWKGSRVKLEAELGERGWIGVRFKCRKQTSYKYRELSQLALDLTKAPLSVGGGFGPKARANQSKNCREVLNVDGCCVMLEGFGRGCKLWPKY
jgi:hypothetical protein